MRELKPLKRLINAKKFSTRLLILASVIETLRQGTEFDQMFSTTCVVGIGNTLAGRDSQYHLTAWDNFAQFYGLTNSQAWYLYLAHYDELGIGLRKSYSGNMRAVTPKKAADVLRRLATKLKEAGK
jgi:hypothetical protein